MPGLGNKGNFYEVLASLILSTLGCFTTVDIRKRMLYRHVYISSLQAQAVPNNLIQLYPELMKRTKNQTGWAIENVNTIDECRPKNVRNIVLIAISRPTGDKRQSKTLVVDISDPRSSMNSFFNCRLSGVETKQFFSR